MGVFGTLVYYLVTPKTGDNFTEFYILGLEGEAADYLETAVVDTEHAVIVGIINREGDEVVYRVQVRINGVTSNEVGPLSMEHEERWEEAVSFTPHEVGDKQEVEFLIYRDEENTPYLQPLRLWIDVKGVE